MPSPIKESAPSLPPPAATTLHPPPSPGTHRALRKLHSAHNLGAKAYNLGGGPSLISQQRQQQQQQNQQQRTTQRSLSPTRRNVSNSYANPTAASVSRINDNNTVRFDPQQHSRKASSGRSPQRGRTNGDAPVLQQQTAAGAVAAVKGRRPGLPRRSAVADELSLERLIPHGPPDGDVTSAIESMRYRVLHDGIKSNTEGMSQLRIYVWLIMLDCPVLETDAYLDLIHRGASPAYSKIRNDTFRTLTTDPLFRRRVSEASLIRLLNAVAWKLHDSREIRQSSTRQSLPHLPESPARPRTATNDTPTSSPAVKNRARALTLTTEGSDAGAGESGTYVQGMNVLAAPFLYAARSEAEAFVAFHQLLTQELPGYIRGAMDGVHKGLRLVDKVLAIVDEKLSKYLMVKGLSAEIYAFPSVLTLCACTPPLPEVLQLWDFLFAYGPGLNILCIVAQLMLIRSQIMASPSPNKLLRSFPTLQADKIKTLTLFIAKNIPDDVYAEIINHAR
ncbi:hypothetical protein MCOR27_008249 [Pyricularia oryzae]|uniref:Rab-GAP TBC domain-containing protein n=2 Tax=Pyricularia TaxID=48558 RepID=A0ABQ8P0U9_PYRGI|nr:hypothetical protein MCOR01_002203 [Pyricularia oryzae]KAI6304897.1 hypothetical protein MCOR33_000020 [Pyricularia grisea]KAH9429214.1 hypothetical protein MCOR02_010623 [Pyricularia oryzae]KAI6262760.1 hypothetical protein MCOR19_001100 [Pyricularia oryzae]KAI6272650.1 hypothetical protein MCOR27_008249 [Pyricularia oryzae]